MSSTVTITITAVEDTHDVAHALAAVTADVDAGAESGGGRLGDLAWTWTATPTVQDQEVVIVAPTEQNPSPHMRCPSCNALDSIVEVDQDVRQNRVALERGEEDDNPHLYAVVYQPTGHGDYETVRFECGRFDRDGKPYGCGAAVVVPMDVSVVYG